MLKHENFIKQCHLINYEVTINIVIWNCKLLFKKASGAYSNNNLKSRVGKHESVSLFLISFLFCVCVLVYFAEGVSDL